MTRNASLYTRLGSVGGVVLMIMVSVACQSAVYTQPAKTSARPGGATSAPSITRIQIEPAKAAIAPGEEVSLSIRVENVSDLAGAEIHLAFDPNVLEVIDADTNADGVQIAHGDLIAADVVGQNWADNAAGTIDYGAAQLQRAGVSGSGTLVVIHFRGKARGSSAITFRGIQSAPSGIIIANTQAVPIDRERQEGSITVK